MSVLEKATALGEAITSSKELANMKEAQEAMMANQEANALVEEFNSKQKKFMDLTSQGVELTLEQKKEAEELEQRIVGNDLILAYFKAQQDFEKMLEEINQIIGKAIMGSSHGRDACSSGCCSSCSGGCE